MKQVVICSEKFRQAMPDKQHINSFRMDGVNITVGLLETEDIPFDESAPENQHAVLVRKKAFSLNYRDKSLIFKSFAYCNRQQDKLFYFPVGSEFVGEVVAAGKAVNVLAIGDRVIGNGAYPHSGYQGVLAGLPTNNASKEYEVFHYGKLLKIPDAMPDAVAAAFTIGGQTTGSIIRRLHLQGGEHILVTAAASNTSLFAINALQSRPVNVYALTTSDRFVDNLLMLGVKHVFVADKDLNLSNHKSLRETVKAIQGFDYVIDPFYDLYLGKVIPTIKSGGGYITCGLYDQYLDDIDQPFSFQRNDYRMIMNTALFNNISIMGNCLGSTSDLEQAVHEHENRKLNVVIDSVFSGGQFAPFFDRTFNQKERFGKVVYQYET